MRPTAVKIFILISLSFLLIGCKNKKEKNQNTISSGYTKIAVDQTLQNVFEKLIYVFESTYVDAKIDPIYTSESEAIELLKKDSVRLAVTARKFTAGELKDFHDRAFEPEAIRIAIDAVAVVVHPENKDTVISLRDLRRILIGEVKDWKQIYPKSRLGKIQVVFDNTKSSIVRYANDSICRDKPLSNELNALEKNEEVVEYISRTKSAIGLIGVNTISDEKDSTVVDFTNKINVMRISYDDQADVYNSSLPYQYFIYNGEYPLRREIFILLNDPRGELPKGFTRFVSDAIGQRIIKKTGLLPSTMPINAVKIIE